MPPTDRKNVVLDATILSTLMSCARLTDFRFNYNFISIGGKSNSLEMGSIVHTILERYYKAVIDGKSRTDAVQIGMNSGKVFSDENANNSSPEELQLVFNTMEQYFDHYKNDFWVPLKVEYVERKEVYVDDEIRIGWKAKIDVLIDTNQGIYSVDHKTMKQRRDTVSLNNQFMGQCVLLGTNKVIINKIGFQTTLKPNEKFTRPTVNYNAARLAEWREVILPYYAKLMLLYSENEYWPPNYTHCENKYGKCNFIEVCEAPPNLREDEIRRLFTVGERWDPQNEEMR